jgi:hypothetical protein
LFGSGLAVILLMVVGGVYHPGLLLTVPIVGFVLLGLLSRDALTARLALMDYGRLMAARARPDDPKDAASADAWLIDPAHQNASPVRRAGILLSLGRDDQARAMLDGASAADPRDAAFAERLRIALDERPHEVDRTAFEAALKGLDRDEARWQRLALAVTLVHRDVLAGRPWRGPFLTGVAGLGPWRPTRGWIAVAVAQVWGAAPFAILLVILAVVAQLPIR